MLHNVDRWSQLDTTKSGDPSSSVQTTRLGASGGGGSSSSAGGGEGGPAHDDKSEQHDTVWSEFRNKGAQYKQRVCVSMLPHFLFL